ncbi:MAG TPA: hypothetical protein VGL88_04705 [Pseudonocardiaceae bacterium]
MTARLLVALARLRRTPAHHHTPDDPQIKQLFSHGARPDPADRAATRGAPAGHRCVVCRCGRLISLLE